MESSFVTDMGADIVANSEQVRPVVGWSSGAEKFGPSSFKNRIRRLILIVTADVQPIAVLLKAVDVPTLAPQFFQKIRHAQFLSGRDAVPSLRGKNVDAHADLK